ncbi:hypothetical protein AQUCO_01700468v1 [Aquilegia coerulea]|uniref:Uncharacterized protein n=1 Tax=Aquilegia coerulea TaxID=218851 RepID=A0A2G5DN39_AQUCA|nr:hypothetical protein AQUCO_01700468v1 [Aquilegia coerulea]
MEENVFVETSIPEEKVFDGVVLPKTLIPVQPSCSVEDLILGINRNRDWLCASLRRHGAVLFRGFNLQTGSDFPRVVEAFGWDHMDYVGASPRIKVTDRVYTANEAPLHLFIDFHHEMSLEMEHRLPEFVKKLERLGFVSDLVFPKEDTDQLIVGTTLTSILGTNDPTEAKKRAKENMACSCIEFTEDGSAKVTFGPLEPIRTMQGERLWFNNIWEDGQKPRLGDGSPIPEEVSNTYHSILNEISVDIK